MSELKTWGDLLAAGQGMPQSALVAVFIGPDQVAATIRPMVGGFCIDTGAVVVEEAAADTPADPIPLAPETIL